MKAHNRYPASARAYVNIGIETAVMNASPYQLIVISFDAALSALGRARLFMQQGDIAAKGNAISQAIGIIDAGLRASFDLKQGGELAEKLHALYDYMSSRLVHANRYNDHAVLSEVLGLLQSIADAWKQIGPEVEQKVEQKVQQQVQQKVQQKMEQVNGTASTVTH